MRQIEPARRYGVHKIFGPTIQGEGGMAGTVCHFLRLSGCNMWDGRPETRAASHCPFCDTDFFSHTMMTAEEIGDELLELTNWIYRPSWVTISGGEPALQIDQDLIDVLHRHFEVAVESNGTRALEAKVDYLTVSPKLPMTQTVVRECDSLKLLWPHPNPAINPHAYNSIRAGERYLQPIETGDTEQDDRNIQSAIRELYAMPNWKLGLQTHKMIGVE